MDEKPIDRIRKIIAYKKMLIAPFERAIGASNNSIRAALQRNTNVKGTTLNKVLKRFPDISPEWLLTGQGEMIKDVAQLSEPADVYLEDSYLIELQKEMIIMLKDKITALEKEITRLNKKQIRENPMP